MDRKKVFNDLVDYYGKLFPQNVNKQKKVSEEWKEMRDIKDTSTFKSAVEAKKKEWKQLHLSQGRANMTKFFTFPKTKAKVTETILALKTTPIATEVDLTTTSEIDVSPDEVTNVPVPVQEVICFMLLFENKSTVSVSCIGLCTCQM